MTIISIISSLDSFNSSENASLSKRFMNIQVINFFYAIKKVEPLIPFILTSIFKKFTQRDQAEREVGRGIGMGNTYKPMADSCHCMTKTTIIL